MLDAEKLREIERTAIEARLGDRFTFTVPQTARALNKSVEWVRDKVKTGDLKSVRLGAYPHILRPTLIAVLTNGTP